MKLSCVIVMPSIIISIRYGKKTFSALTAFSKIVIINLNNVTSRKNESALLYMNDDKCHYEQKFH